MCERCELINPKELLFVIKRERRREYEATNSVTRFNTIANGSNVRDLYKKNKRITGNSFKLLSIKKEP